MLSLFDSSCLCGCICSQRFIPGRWSVMIYSIASVDIGQTGRRVKLNVPTHGRMRLRRPGMGI